MHPVMWQRPAYTLVCTLLCQLPRQQVSDQQGWDLPVVVLKVCLGFTSFVSLVLPHSSPAPAHRCQCIPAGMSRDCFAPDQACLCSLLFLCGCLGSSPQTTAPPTPAHPSLSKMHFEALAVVIRGWKYPGPTPCNGALRAGLVMGSFSCSGGA